MVSFNLIELKYRKIKEQNDDQNSLRKNKVHFRKNTIQTSPFMSNTMILE